MSGAQRARRVRPVAGALGAAATVLGVDAALASSDTTFSRPLDTVSAMVSGTGGQFAVALAVGAALVESVLRFNAMQLMGAVSPARGSRRLRAALPMRPLMPVIRMLSESLSVLLSRNRCRHWLRGRCPWRQANALLVWLERDETPTRLTARSVHQIGHDFTEQRKRAVTQRQRHLPQGGRGRRRPCRA